MINLYVRQHILFYTVSNPRLRTYLQIEDKYLLTALFCFNRDLMIAFHNEHRNVV